MNIFHKSNCYCPKCVKLLRKFGEILKRDGLID